MVSSINFLSFSLYILPLPNAWFSKKPLDDTLALAPLFGPPLESAFDEQKTEGRELHVYSTAIPFLLQGKHTQLKCIVSVQSDRHGGTKAPRELCFLGLVESIYFEI